MDDKIDHTFTFLNNAKSVHLILSTDWKKKHPMTNISENVFMLVVPLSPGVYEYKFQLDEIDWKCDENEPQVKNGNHTNNILCVYDRGPSILNAYVQAREALISAKDKWKKEKLYALSVQRAEWIFEDFIGNCEKCHREQFCNEITNWIEELQFVFKKKNQDKQKIIEIEEKYIEKIASNLLHDPIRAIHGREPKEQSRSKFEKTIEDWNVQLSGDINKFKSKTEEKKEKEIQGKKKVNQLLKYQKSKDDFLKFEKQIMTANKILSNLEDLRIEISRIQKQKEEKEQERIKEEKMNAKRVYYDCVKDLTCIEPIMQKIRERFINLFKYSENEFLEEPCILFIFDAIFSPTDLNVLPMKVKKWEGLTERCCIVLVHDGKHSTKKEIDTALGSLNYDILHVPFHSKFDSTVRQFLEGEDLTRKIIKKIENF